MKIITRAVTFEATFVEHVDPSSTTGDDEATGEQESTRYSCCECLFVERNARQYPCETCRDNMVVATGSLESHFEPRDSENVMYFDDKVFDATE